MNKDNIKKAIAIMERAKARDSVYMSYWQTDKDGGDLATGDIAKTEQEFHACGNKACFAGHIAVSPEWTADGGRVDGDGKPVFGDEKGALAIAGWLGVSVECADHVVNGTQGDYYSRVYPVNFWLVTADHVIFVLNQLLDLGEEKCLELWC